MMVLTSLSADDKPATMIDAEESTQKSRADSCAYAPGSSINPPDTPVDKIYELGSIIVSATRTRRKQIYTPNTTYIVKPFDESRIKIPNSLPMALGQTPGIMVQKTSNGQESPFIRGFTGFRNLFLIDGIRLNNSVFREGPNQYWNTVDIHIFERFEIVKGPGAVLYGSDAIGGTLNSISKKNNEINHIRNFSFSFLDRLSTAENSHISRLETRAALNNGLGINAGLSIKKFGDVESGGEAGKQPHTGFKEYCADFKLDFLHNHGSRLVLAHQYSFLDDIWRTHKTIYGTEWQGTLVGNERSRILDQKRNLSYLQYYKENLGPFIDMASFSLSYQYQSEYQERFKSNGSGDIQGFKVGTIGLWSKFESSGRLGNWTYGFDLYRDDVKSYKDLYDSTGTFIKSEIQGPVGDDAEYEIWGAFIQNEMTLSRYYDLIIGARYSYIKAAAQKVKDPFSSELMAIADQWSNIIWSARILRRHFPHKTTNIFAGISTGFRAPNLSDLTRFDAARSSEIETPSGDLVPEKFLTCETGFKIGIERRLFCQSSWYYTFIKDMIIRTPTGNIIEDLYEVKKRNSGNGFVYGFEINFKVYVNSRFSIFGAMAAVEGELDSYPSFNADRQREPLDRLMPLSFNLGGRWENLDDRFWLEGYLAASDRQNNLSSRDKMDLQRIPPGGTPGFMILNLGGGININKNLALSVFLENIADRDYRIHGSGINEPGRNLIMSIKAVY